MLHLNDFVQLHFVAHSFTFPSCTLSHFWNQDFHIINYTISLPHTTTSMSWLHFVTRLLDINFNYTNNTLLRRLLCYLWPKVGGNSNLAMVGKWIKIWFSMQIVDAPRVCVRCAVADNEINQWIHNAWRAKYNYD